MTSAMEIDQAERRVNDFQKRCGEYGEAALHLAYHAALPVALNAELLHLLRINFFLDPPEVLPYTVEFEFLLSPLCREIDEGLYEIEPEIRDALLARLTQEYDAQRIQDIATLLWQYTDHHSPWADRMELERAQQLTSLNFLSPEKAQQWLATVETEVSQGQVAAREWFVAMRQEIENQAQLGLDEKQQNQPLEKLITKSIVISNISHLRESIVTHLKMYSQKTDEERLQKEIARLIVLLQRVEKLVLRTQANNYRKLHELNNLVSALKVGIFTLFAEEPHIELSRQIRIDVEEEIVRNENWWWTRPANWVKRMF